MSRRKYPISPSAAPVPEYLPASTTPRMSDPLSEMQFNANTNPNLNSSFERHSDNSNFIPPNPRSLPPPGKEQEFMSDMAPAAYKSSNSVQTQDTRQNSHITLSDNPKPGIMSGQSYKAGATITSKRRYYPVQDTMLNAASRQITTDVAARPITDSHLESVPSKSSVSRMDQAHIPSSHILQSNLPQANQETVRQQFGSMALQQQPQPLANIVNLSQEKNLFDNPMTSKPDLPEIYRGIEYDQSIFCCTLNAIPHNGSLLSKCKVPLGLYIHPYKDIQNLTVVSSSVITRCRVCRAYLNPFVTLLSNHKWKCNLCFRVNDLPNEFVYNSNISINKRPELRNCTVEFIAPSEYMVRPPQPAVYLFMFDVSFTATSTGYLEAACRIMKEELDKLPGDSRTMIGIIAFDSSIHFFNLKPSLPQPQMLVISEVNDIFLPSPDDLLVNLQESKELVLSLLDQLPNLFDSSRNVHSATGAAMQAGYKLLMPTGGRITVFQVSLPNFGPGALKMREDPNQRAAATKEIPQLVPATDFYKKLALDCCSHQICIDLFSLATQYADLSSLSCVSKYSAGCIYYYCNYHRTNSAISMKFESEFRRYLSRSLGLEAVMRIRCTRGLSIHTFYGNFFVRSTDLLALPNINPDTSFGMQVSIEESLSDLKLACFQAALLYTNTKGERRIRVHTLAIPIVASPDQIYRSLDCRLIVNLLSKMAVDRTLTASIGDAREALLNAIIDTTKAFKAHIRSSQKSEVILPSSLKLLPLYILGLLKHTAFRLGTSTSLDARTFALHQFNTLPVKTALLTIYPALYALHDLDKNEPIRTASGIVPNPPQLPLSWEKIYKNGIYLLDAGTIIFIWIGKAVDPRLLNELFDKDNFLSLPDTYMISLPELNNALSSSVRKFVNTLRLSRPICPPLYIIREDSRFRKEFSQNFVNDRTEATMSYFEFMVHVQKQLI